MTSPAKPRTRKQPLHVAIVGKPNTGKSALFNMLTGARQKVSNYPGVTVERKEGVVATPQGQHLVLHDLPGIYSLRAHRPDEAITRQALLGELTSVAKPDALICLIDATNMRHCLRLILELKQLGIPMIVVLSMIDLARSQGIEIDVAALSQTLDCTVIDMVTTDAARIATLLHQLDQTLCHIPHKKTKTPAVKTTVEHLRTLSREAEVLAARVVKNVGRPHGWTEKLDAVLLHPWFGLPIMIVLMLLIFQAVFSFANYPMDMIDQFIGALSDTVMQNMADTRLRSLVVDGMIAGVGSVIIFLPQIIILFTFIVLMEDSGYLARTAYLLDRLMRNVGLQGPSFIPLLSSFACAIPGIMATRTIANPRYRLMTMMIAPLMTCSARIPVYTLIIAAFIPAITVAGGWLQLQGLVMMALYAIGLLSGLVVAALVAIFAPNPHTLPDVFELPTYKWPSIRSVLLAVMTRAKIFLQQAGTVIFVISVALWFLSSYPQAPEQADQPAIYYSVAGVVGRTIEPVFAPIGFNWQIAVGLIPGLAAREVVVGALGTIYALSEPADETSQSLIETLRAGWTLPMALSFLAWFIFAPQCLATLAVVKRETSGWLWPSLMFVYLFALAYVASFVTFRVATMMLT